MCLFAVGLSVSLSVSFLDIMLLDRHGQRQFMFPRRYRNFVSFCPFGQMAVIAGFGNLAGRQQKSLSPLSLPLSPLSLLLSPLSLLLSPLSLLLSLRSRFSCLCLPSSLSLWCLLSVSDMPICLCVSLLSACWTDNSIDLCIIISYISFTISNNISIWL